MWGEGSPCCGKGLKNVMGRREGRGVSGMYIIVKRREKEFSILGNNDMSMRRVTLYQMDAGVGHPRGTFEVKNGHSHDI